MKVVQHKKLLLLSLFTALFFITSTAWSYDYYNSNFPESVSRETFSNALDSVPVPGHKAPICSSLLKSLDTPQSAHSPAEGQRKVGKVAALSMILGARYALAPSNQNQDVRQSDYVATYPAQIIAAYRQCRKDFFLRVASSQ